MKYKIIGIDLDGTLLNSFKRISNKNLNALSAYINRGGIPVIVTGRSSVSAYKYFNKIQKHSARKLRFIACFNGAYIYDQLENKEYKKFISNEIAKEIYDYAQKNKLTAWFYTERATAKKAVEVKGYRLFLTSKFFKNLNLLKVNPRADISSYKINLMSFSKQKIAKTFEELKKIYKDKLVFSLSSKNLIEINSFGIDKGYAMNFVLEKTKTKKDNSIFFGDSFNDVPAFKACGYSYAIKPKNKDVCNFSSKTIDYKKNAVASIINKSILEKDDGKQIRLIATDLDGTLLENKTKEIIPSTVEKIRVAVDDKNTYFAIATGRNIDDVKLIVKNIGIKNINNCFGILNNGAIVYEFKTDQYIYQRQLTESMTQIILNEIKSLNASKKFGNIGCYIHRTIDLKKLKDKQKTELYGYNLKFVKTRLAWMSSSFTKNNWYPKNFNEINDDDILASACKFVIYTDSPSNNAKVFEHFKSMQLDVSVTTSSPTNVEVNANGVSKGNALSFLSQRLGININQVMTLGDEENDISMLSLTSNSYTLKTSKVVVKNAASNVLDTKPSYLVGEAITQKILEE